MIYKLGCSVYFTKQDLATKTQEEVKQTVVNGFSNSVAEYIAQNWDSIPIGYVGKEGEYYKEVEVYINLISNHEYQKLKEIEEKYNFMCFNNKYVKE